MITVFVPSSCTFRPKFGHTPTERLVGAMTIEEKKSLLSVRDGHTASLERMQIPSVSIREITHVPEQDLLLRSWNKDLAYQAGLVAGSQVVPEEMSCVCCPVLQTEDENCSAVMTAALARGIRECGHNVVVFSDTAYDGNVITSVQPMAVIVNDSIPRTDYFDGPVFVTGNVSDSLSEDVLDSCVTKVIAFLEQSIGTKAVAADVTVPDRDTYHRNLLEESMVLLKNDGTVPFGNGNMRIALYGKASYGLFDKAVQNAGFKLEPSVVSYYGKRNDAVRRPYQYRADAIASNYAVAVFDHELDNADMTLVSDVCTAFHDKSRKVVVILATDGPVDTECWAGYPDAIIYASRPDRDVAEVTAAILRGTLLPSGRLVQPWSSYPFGFGLGYTPEF